MNELNGLHNPDLLRALARERMAEVERALRADRLAHRSSGAALDPISRARRAIAAPAHAFAQAIYPREYLIDVS